MEAVLFIGIQAAGKTTFYRERFFETHVRLSLDLLRTRRRERLLLAACIEAQQRFVVDNTNPTAAERAVYIEAARAGGFRVVGYFFEPDPEGSYARNEARARQVPPAGLFGTLTRLERPHADEGFDALHRASASPRAASPSSRTAPERAARAPSPWPWSTRRSACTSEPTFDRYVRSARALLHNPRRGARRICSPIVAPVRLQVRAMRV